MPLAQLKDWEYLLIQALGLPILTKLKNTLQIHALKTKTLIDDELIEALEIVINFLHTPGIWKVH